MKLKITFVDPNNSKMADKYLPKILAEALMNKINKEMNCSSMVSNVVYDERHLA